LLLEVADRLPVLVVESHLLHHVVAAALEVVVARNHVALTTPPDQDLRGDSGVKLASVLLHLISGRRVHVGSSLQFLSSRNIVGETSSGLRRFTDVLL